MLLQAETGALRETWLLLEFCDRGSLQDIMDRGAFRPTRIENQGSVVRPRFSCVQCVWNLRADSVADHAVLCNVVVTRFLMID